MEKDKEQKKNPVFLFDLEKELSSDDKRREYIKLLEKRILSIKNMLHSGSKKEVFDILGTLLNGYHALTVVLSRASKQ